MTDRDSGGLDAPRRLFAEAARASKPDLAVLCLLLGAVVGASPLGLTAAEAERTVDEGQLELDRLTGELPYAVGRTPAEWVHTMAKLLGEQYGFGGTSSDYDRLRSSLLGEVLRRRRGLPILLSIVWIEVARRAGARCTGWRCRGTSWSVSAIRRGSWCWPTRTPAGGC